MKMCLFAKSRDCNSVCIITLTVSVVSLRNKKSNCKLSYFSSQVHIRDIYVTCYYIKMRTHGFTAEEGSMLKLHT